MLDSAHSLALRGVARGALDESHAPAVRNLAVAGLVQPVDGAWALTQAGHAVLELEGDADPAGSGDLSSKIRDWFMK
jgi:phosphohistidine phosphatase SixA